MKIIYILLILIIIVTNSYALRIVSVAPSITENLFHIGAGDSIVAVTDVCNYPMEANKKIRIGSYYKPNIEKILTLKPDIVIGMKEGYTEQLKIKLDRFNIKNVFYEATSIEDIQNIIIDLGKITQIDTSHIINKIKSTFAIKPKIQNSAFFLLSSEPIFTVGNNSFINSIMRCAGLSNITHEMNANYPQISIELIYQKNPDFIIESGMDAGSTHNSLRAKLRKIGLNPIFIPINPDIYNRASYRVVDACKDLKQKIRQANDK